MTTQFMLPELGEHVESAELIKILVSVGARVEFDQPVLELETDKADFELPSAVGGIVKEIHVREGEKVKVGQLLFTLDDPASTAASAASEDHAPAAQQEIAAKVAPERRQSQDVSGRLDLPLAPVVLPARQAEADTPRDAIAESAPRRLVPTTPTVRRLARELGKTPVEVNDYPGFVANRVLMPMINEAVFCLMEGVASAESIDTVMRLGMHHPLGPLALADLIGLDVCLAILEVLHRGLGDDKYRPCPLLRRMVAAGQLGRKSGRGFYDYRAEAAAP